MSAPIIHCHGTQADEHYNRYAALQKAWRDCPSLDADPRFVALRQEAYAKFSAAFEVQ